MKTIQCTVEVLPDGSMILPEDIVRKMNIKTKSRLQILILNEERTENNLNRFSGKWQDDRGAEDIISVSCKNQENKFCNPKASSDIFDEIIAISKRCTSIPDKDSRSPEDILEYNRTGIPE